MLIIVLHTAPLSSYSTVLSYGLRNIVTVVAVPFFFMTSGFLLFDKLNRLPEAEKGAYFKRYIGRLVLMYVLWTVVYFPFVLTQWLQKGCTVMDVLQYIKRFFFEGSYSTIWFLPALITAAALVYFLRKRLSFRNIVLVALPFYIFACLGSSYYGLTEQIPVLRTVFQAYFSFFDTIKNGVLFGFLFVALGAAFTEPRKPVKSRSLFLFSVVFFVLMAGETVVQTALHWSTNGVDTKLVLIPLSICLFAWILSLTLSDAHQKAYVWMRKLSLLMFLSQRIFITLVDWYLAETVLRQNSLCYFACIFGGTMLFSYGFILLSRKLKVLQYFY